MLADALANNPNLRSVALLIEIRILFLYLILPSCLLGLYTMIIIIYWTFSSFIGDIDGECFVAMVIKLFLFLCQFFTQYNWKLYFV